MNKKTSNISYGGKADSLLFLKNQGFTIPRGFVISNDEFLDVLEYNQRKKDFVELITEQNILYRPSKLQNLIMELEVNAALMEKINDHASFYGNEIIVRSSADNEDTIHNSMAGLYDSISANNDIKLIFTAIKKCWASAFSSKVFSILGGFPERMHILVQEYIKFEKSGVAFSTDVTFHDPDSFLIEAVEGNCDKLVDGLSNANQYRLRKHQSGIEAGIADLLLQDADLEQVQNALTNLVNLLGYDVDIEWGIDKENNFFLLQCRPVTTLTYTLERKSSGIFMTTDEITHFSKTDMGQCTVHYQGFLNKKYWARYILKEKEYNLAKVGYFFYNLEEIRTEAIADLLKQFNSRLIEIRNDDENIIVQKTVADVKKVLTQLGDQVYSVVYVAEIIDTDRAGYATRMPSGEIYIEAVNGGFHGLWKGGITPSKFVVTQAGEICSQEINTSDTEYEYSLTSLTWLERASPTKRACVLSEKEIKKIIDMTIDLEEKIPGVSIEWISNQEDIYYFDLSQEIGSKAALEQSIHVLSAGQCTGKIRIIDSRVLDDLFDSFHEVNVVRKDHYFEKVESENVRAKLKQVIGEDSDILVCDFPNRTLAPLVPYVKGFIFNNGAALCHLGIILRESQTPAVIMNHASERLKDADTVTILDGKVLY